jgi:hypothetical protein
VVAASAGALLEPGGRQGAGKLCSTARPPHRLIGFDRIGDIGELCLLGRALIRHSNRVGTGDQQRAGSREVSSMLRVALVLLLLLASPVAHAEKRVALIIGNSAYKHAGMLPNPMNDCRRHGGHPEAEGLSGY